jgi:hypothetical protein
VRYQWFCVRFVAETKSALCRDFLHLSLPFLITSTSVGHIPYDIWCQSDEAAWTDDMADGEMQTR